jgi:DnaJ-class molecular chaperone
MKACPTCSRRKVVLKSFPCEACEIDGVSLGVIEIKGGPRDGEWIECPTCQGYKVVVSEVPCPTCKGVGEVR